VALPAADVLLEMDHVPGREAVLLPRGGHFLREPVFSSGAPDDEQYEDRSLHRIPT
jgi:hypothetical protein